MNDEPSRTITKPPGMRHRLSNRMLPSVMRWLARLLLIFFPLSAILVLTEVALRLLGVSYPVFGQADPDLGYIYTPGTRAWFREEGEAFIRINDLGYRGPERPFEKPADVYRIAVLGDSFTAGFAVDEDSTFASVLERRLGDCAALDGKRVECLNFGVVGWGNAQSRLAYRRDARRYEPDLVILAVCVGNDIRNNSRAISGHEPRPYYVLDRDSLRLDLSFRSQLQRAESGPFKSMLSWTTRRSRVLQVLRRARHVIPYQIRQWQSGRDTIAAAPGTETPIAANEPTRQPPTLDGRLPGDELGLDLQVYGEPKDRDWKEAWEITERIVLELRTDVERDGARFLVTTLCQSAQVQTVERRHAIRELLRNEIANPDLFYPERRFRSLAERGSLDVLTIARRFQEEADREGHVFHGYEPTGIAKGHFNERGHRLAGELLAEFVCGRLAGH